MYDSVSLERLTYDSVSLERLTYDSVSLERVMYDSVSLERLTYDSVSLERVTYKQVRLESLTYDGEMGTLASMRSKLGAPVYPHVASKVMVSDVSVPERGVVVDMIAVTPP